MRFQAVALPVAGESMLRVLADVAQKDVTAISTRTYDELAAKYGEHNLVLLSTLTLRSLVLLGG